MADKSGKIRTRFAPSPTGFVHIGSLRTALFSFLFARHEQGVNILRIEDTDQDRFVEGAIENMLSVLKQMGVEFDEGFYDEAGEIKERGEHGPYLQSKRLDLYKKYALQLVEQSHAYYCFCTQQRLDDLRKEQIALKKPPMYDRLCRKLGPDAVKSKLEEFKAAGKNPVIRQAIPESGETVVQDLIYGDVKYEHRILDDQVILKSDGFPTYHLAVVVDDHLMEISHVIRGEEWLPSTPKHLLLYKAFGWQPTQFAHLPLILNPDKSKLSKRQGDVAVEDFLTKGYLKEALINFVAFLGWNPKTEQEIFSMENLIEQFDLSKVNKAAAVFDINKLEWLNGLYIRKKTLRELTSLLIPYWQKQGIDASKYKQDYLEAIAGLEQERLKKLSEIGERTAYFFAEPEYDSPLLIWKKSSAGECKTILEKLVEFLAALDEKKFARNEIEAEIKGFIAKNNFNNGSVLWPLRAALTGMDKSPGPFDIIAALYIGPGKVEIINRIKTAIKKLS